MSGITLKKTVAASIPTPATDKITIFHDDSTDAPAYKDDLGVTNPIGGGAPSGSAGGVLGGTYPNPSFAADMATQAELDAHTADTTDAHDASAVSIVDAGGFFTGTEVEAALQELGAGSSGAPTGANYLVGSSQAGLSAEIIVGTTPGGELGGTWASPTVDGTHSGSTHAATQSAAEATAASALSAHTADTSDAHDASAVSIVDAGSYFTGTEVEAALQELGAGSAGPIVYVRDGSASAHDADSFVAGAALLAAVASLPTGTLGGGIIQLGHGFYDLADSGAGSQLDLTGLTNVHIRGIGGVTGGAATGTTIETYNQGSGSIVLLGDSTGCGFYNLMIRYEGTSFTGNLLSTTESTGQATSLTLENVILWGLHDSGETAVLLNINRSIIGRYNRVFFNGGGIGVYGTRSVVVTSMTAGDPLIVTAPAHGFTTGEKVSLGAVTTTPPTSTSPPTIEPQSIVVTGANTFTWATSYPVSVVTDGAGWASSTGDFSNVHSFRDCKFDQTVIVPVRNPGDSYVFENTTVQQLASGDVGFIDHNPGNRGRGLTIVGGGNYDQTTTNAGSLIKWAGSGLSITGFNASGRSVSQITFLEIDDNACQGVFVAGNNFNAIYRGLQFGTTTNHIRGQFGPNSYDNDRTGYLPVEGTLPLGISIVPSDQATKPDVFWWAGGGDSSSGVTMLQFDNDTVTRLYRLSAGILFSPAQLQVAGTFYAGLGQTARTQVLGAAGGTLAGLVAGGSNTNVDISLSPKGTGRNVLNSGLSLPTVISPTQLTANTDNWAPTSLETAATIRINVDAARTITGLVAQGSGCMIRLHNTTTFDITLAHDATSTAANRFFCPGAVNFVLRPKASVIIFYSTTDSRWQVGNQGQPVLTTRFAAGVPSGAPTGTELPIAFDSTAVTGGVYYWTGSAWVKGGTI